MKRPLLTGLLFPIACAALVADLHAENPLEISVYTFEQPAGATPFVGFPVAVDVRYSELFSMVPAESNTATHLLIEGLTPLSNGSQILRSNYSAYNLSAQTLQDVGTVYLQADPTAQLGINSVASPIVGLVRRTGAWDNYTSQSPVAEIGGAFGQSSYTGNEQSGGVLNISISRGGQTFSGSVEYSVPDEDTIVLNQHLVLGSYTYLPTTLVRDGSRYYGILETAAVIPNYDAALLKIELTNLPDADGDGIPDITDPSISGETVAPVNLISGDWSLNPIFGWLYGIENSVWANSNFMGFVYVLEFGGFQRWIYQGVHGWMYYAIGSYNDVNGMWLWNEQYGWVNTRESWDGFFYLNELKDGMRWGWFGSTELFPPLD
jgi:hypothetical protein